MNSKSETQNRTRMIPVLCLIFLFLPNVHVVDFLPDFIACFLLSKYFSKAADISPYFNEATVALKRLGWVNLARIPALFLVIAVRAQNQADYDIIVLLSLVFAVGELLLSLQAAHYLFDAFFYLGERTTHASFITPFSYTADGGRRIEPDSLKNTTTLFLLVKALASSAPEFLRLSSTKTSDSTMYVSGTIYYPMILTFALLLATVVGSIWLFRMLAYRRAILADGGLDAALAEMIPTGTLPILENKQKLRALLTVFTAFTIAAFFTMDFAFDTLGNVNILPQFLFAAILCFGVARLRRYAEGTERTLIAGGVYALFSLVSTALTIFFADRYGYAALLRSAEAREAYLPIKIFAIVEFIAFVVFLFFFFSVQNSFVLRETGVSQTSDRYDRTEKEYHRMLKRRNLLLFIVGLLMGGSKCAEAFFRGTVKTVTIRDIGGLEKTMVVPVLEWFPVVVAATSVLYILASLYIYGKLKEDLRRKLSEEPPK